MNTKRLYADELDLVIESLRMRARKCREGSKLRSKLELTATKFGYLHNGLYQCVSHGSSD